MKDAPVPNSPEDVRESMDLLQQIHRDSLASEQKGPYGDYRDDYEQYRPDRQEKANVSSKQKGHVGPDEGDWTFKEWLGFIGAALFVGGACIGGALALRHFYG